MGHSNYVRKREASVAVDMRTCVANRQTVEEVHQNDDDDEYEEQEKKITRYAVQRVL